MANEAGFCSRILFSVAVQLPSKLNHKEATRWPTVHPWFTAALTNACTQPLSQLGFADQRAQSITFQKVFLSYFFPLSQKKGKWRDSLARQTRTAKPRKSFLQQGAKSIPNTPHWFYLHNFDVSLRLSGDQDVPFPSVKLGHTHART